MLFLVWFVEIVMMKVGHFTFVTNVGMVLMLSVCILTKICVLIWYFGIVHIVWVI